MILITGIVGLAVWKFQYGNTKGISKRYTISFHTIIVYSIFVCILLKFLMFFSQYTQSYQGWSFKYFPAALINHQSNVIMRATFNYAHHQVECAGGIL